MMFRAKLDEAIPARSISEPCREFRPEALMEGEFRPEARFASLLVRDRDLAQSLAQGFEGLWRKAMKSLQEIDFDPRGTRHD